MHMAGAVPKLHSGIANVRSDGAKRLEPCDTVDQVETTEGKGVAVNSELSPSSSYEIGYLDQLSWFAVLTHMHEHMGCTCIPSQAAASVDKRQFVKQESTMDCHVASHIRSSSSMLSPCGAVSHHFACFTLLWTEFRLML